MRWDPVAAGLAVTGLGVSVGPNHEAREITGGECEEIWRRARWGRTMG